MSICFEKSKSGMKFELNKRENGSIKWLRFLIGYGLMLNIRNNNNRDEILLDACEP